MASKKNGSQDETMTLKKCGPEGRPFVEFDDYWEKTGPKKVKKKTYKFDKLSPAAKEYAREQWRQFQDATFSPGFFVENILIPAAEEWHNLPPMDDCLFSLNYGQGDYVVFSGRLDHDDLVSICVLPEFTPETPMMHPTYNERAQLRTTFDQLTKMGYQLDVIVRPGGMYRTNTEVEVGFEEEPDLTSRWDDFNDWSKELNLPEDIEASIGEVIRQEDITALGAFLDLLEERGEDVQEWRVRFTPPSVIVTLRDQFEKDFLTFMQAVCKHVMKVGYSDLEWQASDEVVEDNIRSNNYNFSARGELL